MSAGRRAEPAGGGRAAGAVGVRGVGAEPRLGRRCAAREGARPAGALGPHVGLAGGQRSGLDSDGGAGPGLPVPGARLGQDAKGGPLATGHQMWGGHDDWAEV